MRLRRYLLPIALASSIVLGGTRVGAAPPRRTAPLDPTAEGHWYSQRNRFAFAARANAYSSALYVAAAQAYAAAQARAYAAQARAYASAQAAVPKAPAPVPRTDPARPAAQAPTGAVSGACGGATNGADRFIGAESGGNPNARNSSGAWGCYQIVPGTWQRSCSDLGQHGSASAQAQAQCASRLPSSSWAATGG